MNVVLEEILRSGAVRDGDALLPLHSNMDLEEGRLIQEAVRASKPSLSVEVGCAYGVSALFACEALAEVNADGRHVLIDPGQSTQWRGVGIQNLTRAGYASMIELREEGSEVALPKMLNSQARVQFAIIDGWHTFDHALVDFFYVNKMLDVGGIVIVDDTNWQALARLYDHILTYPAYELFGQVGEPRKETGFKAVRSGVRRGLASMSGSRWLRRPVDYPRCAAFRKVAEDTRSWDWHADF